MERARTPDRRRRTTLANARGERALLATLAMILALAAGRVLPMQFAPPAVPTTVSAIDAPTISADVSVAAVPPEPARRPLHLPAVDAPPLSPVHVFGSPAVVKLARVLLASRAVECVFRVDSARDAVAAARGHPSHVALVADPEQSPRDLADRPLFARALAVVAMTARPVSLRWHEFAMAARSARGGVCIGTDAVELLDGAARRVLLTGRQVPIAALPRTLLRHPRALGVTTIAQARAQGLAVIPIDGVEPSAAAVADGRYPLGFSLRIVHRFDATSAVTRVADCLLSAPAAARLQEFWPE